MQNQLDTIVSSLASQARPKETTISAYQSLPRTSVDEKLARLERLVRTHINDYPSQESTLAAYQPSQRETYRRDGTIDEEINVYGNKSFNLKLHREFPDHKGADPPITMTATKHPKTFLRSYHMH